MRAKEFVKEAFDTNVQSKVLVQKPTVFRTSAIIGGREIIFNAIYEDEYNAWQIAFAEIANKKYSLLTRLATGEKDKTYRDAKFGITGKGDQMVVFSFVIQSIKQFINLYHPEIIYFSARKEGSRVDLYSKMAQRIRIPGYELTNKQDVDNSTYFAFKKIGKPDNQQLDELNWRAPVAAAGIIGGVAGGLATHNPQPNEPQAQVMQVDTPTPAVATPLAKAPVKKDTASPKAIAQAESLLNNPNARVLIKTAQAAGIKGTELAQFLAQCAHETKNFTTRREIGDTKYFMKKYDKKYNPQNAALLGNVKPGDGAKYFGRGDIQLTGRDNYTRVGKALGIDLVNHPELAEKPDIAAKIAVYFWQNRVAPKVDNFADTAEVTRPINRRLAGLDDRHEKFTGLHHLIARK